jgi:hypothetical protein
MLNIDDVVVVAVVITGVPVVVVMDSIVKKDDVDETVLYRESVVDRRWSIQNDLDLDDCVE